MGSPFWLTALRMKNFRSFSEVEIKFERSGMTLLRGRNLDTGGSSYSGKTSIPLGISFALGFLPFSAKDQKRWGAEGPMYVELDITNDIGQATIRAGDKASLKLPDGRKVTSSSAIKEELAKFLGVNPDVLAALTYQQQGEKSRFLSKTDSEKKEFLSNVMPWLVKIEQATDVCDSNIIKINQDMAVSTRLVEMADAQLASLAIQEPVLVDLPLVKELKESLVVKRILLAKLLAEAVKEKEVADAVVVKEPKLLALATIKAEAAGRLAIVRGEERYRIGTYNAEYAKVNNLYNETSVQANTLPKLLKEIQSLEANKCPTCFQIWSQVADRLATAKTLLQAAQEAIEALPKIKEARGCLVFTTDPKIVQLEAIVNRLDCDISQLQLEQQNLNNKRTEAIQAATQKIHSMQVQDQQLVNEISNVDNQTAMVAKENERRVGDYTRAQIEKQKIIDRRASIEPELANHRTKLKAEQDFQALIGRGGFLGSIFDEVLAEITTEANVILASVANTAHVTISFLSETSTLKGKINKTIQSVVTIGGHSADLKSGASGGMGTSIGLAVDLAVANVVSRRTNTCPGWLIIDEGFDGLDQISKETAMQILQKNSCNRLIMMIGHSSEFKEMFTDFIDVEFKNGTSRVL